MSLRFCGGFRCVPSASRAARVGQPHSGIRRDRPPFRAALPLPRALLQAARVGQMLDHPRASGALRNSLSQPSLASGHLRPRHEREPRHKGLRDSAEQLVLSLVPSVATGLPGPGGREGAAPTARSRPPRSVSAGRAAPSQGGPAPPPTTPGRRPPWPGPCVPAGAEGSPSARRSTWGSPGRRRQWAGEASSSPSSSLTSLSPNCARLYRCTW